MNTLSLKTLSTRTTKNKSYNKKQAIVNYVKQFQHPFDMKDDGIDLREMAKNFNDGPIPVEEIRNAICRPRSRV